MPGPCPYALALSRVPRRKWSTRAELLERVELTRQLIQLSPGQNLTIASLAGIACLSESHFIRLFGATFGVSPKKMLANQRMESAKLFLSQGRSVGDTALEIGYSSIPTFCRRFKDSFGETPKEFSKRNLG